MTQATIEIEKPGVIEMPKRIWQNFAIKPKNKVVIRPLAEGILIVYPEDVYKQIFKIGKDVFKTFNWQMFNKARDEDPERI